MKLYDITQELFSSRVYPGDPAPSQRLISSIQGGATCNVSEMKLCVHNGTHIDAPCHFVAGGKTIDALLPELFCGECLVAEYSGIVTAQTLQSALMRHPSRLLLKGPLELTPEAACAIAKAGVRLLGVESQSVAPEADPETVHIELLTREVIPLEGLVLRDVPPGSYWLSALPLALGGCDGAPCRAVLMEMQL